MKGLDGSSACWIFAPFVLAILTFGPLQFVYIVLYATCFIFGAIVILYDASKSIINQEDYDPLADSTLLSNGIKKVLEQEKRSLESNVDNDKRLTGSSQVDDAIHECLGFLMRDYIRDWYNDLSDDKEFLDAFRKCLHDIIRTFASRCKNIDWQQHLTSTVVDAFICHVRMFRKAQDRVNKRTNQRDSGEFSSSDGGNSESYSRKTSNQSENKNNSAKGLVDFFFENEIAATEICHELVACDHDKQKQYLQDLCEVLLYLLLPEDEFHCRPFKLMLRETMVNGIFIPMIELYSDPDYINQCASWLIGDSCLSSEWFLSVLRHTQVVEELQAIREKADDEFEKLRAKDTVGDDFSVKQQLSSMRYVKTLCEKRIRIFHDGKTALDGNLVDLDGLPEDQSKLYNLPLNVILRNNIALQIFIEYMQSVNGQAYLFFWLTIDGYRASAEQQLNEFKLSQQQGAMRAMPDMEILRAIGNNIYEQYLSKQAEPRVAIDAFADKQLLKKLSGGEPSPFVFDDIQQKVYQIMLKEEIFYPAFKKTKSYMQLLAELDLLRAPSINSEDTSDTSSVNMMDDVTAVDTDDSFRLTAEISQTGICTEHGKTYALYAIAVTRHYSNGQQERWDTFRRYREFHDLHQNLRDSGSNLGNLRLPGRTFFKLLKEEFLEKRRLELNHYLSCLLSMEHNLRGMECLHLFLDAKAYQKKDRTFASKVDTMMRTSVRNVTNFVQQAPDNLLDRVQRASDMVTDGWVKLSSDLFPTNVPPARHSPHQDNIDANTENSIPMGVLIVLMDEVFDLKHRNQWLRRQIVAVLQQFVRTLFGDRMNKKIFDYIDNLLSADELAEYIHKFRDTFWPGGILADTAPERDDYTKMRTRVLAMTKMHGVIPDELRSVVGAETCRCGVVRLFDMIQFAQLNRRFCFVMLQLLLQRVFPCNRFDEMAAKFHRNSPLMRASKRHAHDDRAGK